VLRAAAAAGVQVSIDGESLVLEAASEPPKALIKALKKHKTKILSLLKAAARHEAAPTGAAIAGLEGGIPSAWAEALAKLSRQRRPPDDVSYRQWDQLRDGFVRFCKDWAGPAEALGWRPRDLLGWDPRYPYTPIAKRLGLAWRFDGADVVEVRRDAIVIERWHGLRTTLPRIWII
jgi:hypothetical protein